jgi:hypothetical protein
MEKVALLALVSSVASQCIVTFTGQADHMEESLLRRHQSEFAGCVISYYSRHMRQKALVKWGERDALRALNIVSHPVMEADIFRLAALYHTGGYYLDLKSGFQPGKTWRCLDQFSQTPWVTLTQGGFWISNWLMYSPARDKNVKLILDNIVSDVLARTNVAGNSFEQKVWNLTGPRAIGRYLGNMSTVPAEKMCCIFNPLGAESSWHAPNSYHNYPDTFPVYKDI